MIVMFTFFKIVKNIFRFENYEYVLGEIQRMVFSGMITPCTTLGVPNTTSLGTSAWVRHDSD